jgi:hypothetical protein
LESVLSGKQSFICEKTGADPLRTGLLFYKEKEFLCALLEGTELVFAAMEHLFAFGWISPAFVSAIFVVIGPIRS